MHKGTSFFAASLASVAFTFGAVSAHAQEAVEPAPRAETAPQQVVQLNSMAEYKKLISTSDKPVLVDFYAAWCGYCKQLSPVLDKFAQGRSDVIVAKIDADRVRSVGDLERIKGYPTLKLFVDGKAVNVGNTGPSLSGLDQFVQKGVAVAPKKPNL